MKCNICGKEIAVAKIEGKYYCYSCGSQLLKEHVLRLLKELERKGLAISAEQSAENYEPGNFAYSKRE
ncbi:MAG: hypothetical protein QW731_08380 [Thermofilaceae archaeon]